MYREIVVCSESTNVCGNYICMQSFLDWRNARKSFINRLGFRVYVDATKLLTTYWCLSKEVDLYNKFCSFSFHSQYVFIFAKTWTPRVLVWHGGAGSVSEAIMFPVATLPYHTVTGFSKSQNELVSNTKMKTVKTAANPNFKKELNLRFRKCYSLFVDRVLGTFG